MRMAAEMQELYSSPNGDRWYLARDVDLGKVFIRHEPNLPSGGEAAHIEIGAFLGRGGQGSGHWWSVTIPSNAERLCGSNRTPRATLWN